MDEPDEQLHQLIDSACKHPIGSRQCRKALTEVILLIAKSGKLWRENIPDYEDALQQTWLYFSRNIFSGVTQLRKKGRCGRTKG